MRDKPSTSRRSGRPPTPALPVDTRRSTSTQDNEWQNEAHANHAPYGLICASYFTLFWVAKSIYSDIFFSVFSLSCPTFYFVLFSRNVEGGRKDHVWNCGFVSEAHDRSPHAPSSLQSSPLAWESPVWVRERRLRSDLPNETYCVTSKVSRQMLRRRDEVRMRGSGRRRRRMCVALVREPTPALLSFAYVPRLTYN